MRVLSLFDGMSCCHLALERIGVNVEEYWAAEIDKYAIQITQKNYPDTKQLGSVLDWGKWDIPWNKIDLVTGGFPCQAWSLAGKQLGDKDERGKLFWTMLDIISHAKKHNPNIKFLIENVKMKKEFEEYITRHTKEALGGVDKVLLNSALVSAQNRQRYYWHNLGEVKQPEDKRILLQDIMESQFIELSKEKIEKNKVVLRDNYKEFKENSLNHVANAKNIKGNESIKRVYAKSGKGPTLTTMGGGHREPKVLNVNDNKRVKGITENERGYRPHRGDIKSTGISELGRIIKPEGKTDTVIASHALNMALNNDIDNLHYRKLTPLECERLQTVPDNYTEGVSNTQRYKMLGNGWTVDVIAHIFKNLTTGE